MGQCHSICVDSSVDRFAARLVRAALLCAVLISSTSCRHEQSPPGEEAAPPPAAATSGRTVDQLERLRVDGLQFVTSSGRPFQWRGVTAFRLVDYVADGEADKAEAFLAWAAQQELTVVRVLTMMGGQFDLRPEDGRRALPRVLEMAAARGLYVEVVGLAGTADIPVDLDAHIDAIARILGEHPNGLLEIANEPVHPSQSAAVQQPSVLERLAGRVAKEIPVSLGSIERGDGFGAGSYITWHAPRESGQAGWGHVLALAEGSELLRRWKKPVVSDEPIGAGPELQPGRRDNVPARFRAAALLTRLTGVGATFHYESGLQALIPGGRELESFNAWNEAWTLLPADVERQGAFMGNGAARSVVAAYDRAAIPGVFERVDKAAGWILVVGGASADVKLADGWTVAETRELDGARLLRVTRSSS